MGLDMYLIRLNKKFNQDDMKQLCIYREKEYNLKYYTDFINDYNNAGSARKMGLEKFGYKIEAYEKWSKNGKKKKENDIFADDYVYNYISAETPRFQDFETKEKLIEFYEKEAEEQYKDILEDLKNYQTTEWEALKIKFQNVEYEEVGYWRKHADLNGYFTQMAIDRNILDQENDDFNGQQLVLTEDDIKTLLKLVEKELKGENIFETATGFFWGQSDKCSWEETKEIFDSVMKNTDFKNNTIVYECSW